MVTAASKRHADLQLPTSTRQHGAMAQAPTIRRDRVKELGVPSTLYLLQAIIAEMLRRAAGTLDRHLTSTASGRLVADWALFQAD
ncbi:MAG: hypothetical protein FJ077_07430, partial [Cyanobacteria bacterium K_DeepCast_35m_m2_023]|nr:hypothetical protein [Cyanobacteria bacterium K_DeepCast_35m_m2_023]